MGNIFKTGLLLAVLSAMLVLLGGALGGRGGMLFGFVMAFVMNVGAYWFSDKIVLSMYGAQPVDEAQAPELYGIVRRLAQRAGLPMPRVYIIADESPNAFATGRNAEHAVVAVTSGVLRILDNEELEGVLAHELAHVKNRDMLISTIAATLAGAITYIAHMLQWSAFLGGHRDDDEGGSPIGALAMAIVAPIAAMLVQMAVSRAREYEADATGARIVHSTKGLQRALQKLHMAAHAIPMQANPATAHLFIVNPLAGRSFATLFSTHPPLEDRIARLAAMRM